MSSNNFGTQSSSVTLSSSPTLKSKEFSSKLVSTSIPISIILVRLLLSANPSFTLMLKVQFLSCSSRCTKKPYARKTILNVNVVIYCPGLSMKNHRLCRISKSKSRLTQTLQPLCHQERLQIQFLAIFLG